MQQIVILLPHLIGIYMNIARVYHFPLSMLTLNSARTDDPLKDITPPKSDSLPPIEKWW